jgi:hypothetical protein
MVMGDPAGGERNILFIIRGEAPPASDTVPAATPDTAINDIPIYPGATPAESGSELAEMVDSMRRQSGGDVVEGYVLPEGITYEDAIAFYKAEMPELGWRFVPIRVNSDIGISTTWIRDAEEGGIAIMAMDDTSGRDRDFLFITGPVSP